MADKKNTDRVLQMLSLLSSRCGSVWIYSPSLQLMRVLCSVQVLSEQKQHRAGSGPSMHTDTTNDPRSHSTQQYCISSYIGMCVNDKTSVLYINDHSLTHYGVKCIGSECVEG